MAADLDDSRTLPGPRENHRPARNVAARVATRGSSSMWRRGRSRAERQPSARRRRGRCTGGPRTPSTNRPGRRVAQRRGTTPRSCHRPTSARSRSERPSSRPVDINRRGVDSSAICTRPERHVHRPGLGRCGEGSRPLVEATVFAGVEPPTDPDDERAPGEAVDGGSANEGDGLALMVNAARTASGRAALERSHVLDDLARNHALRMSATQELAHDVGDGNPAQRLASAGVGGVEVGENVGRARSVAMAHRQIWNSPSHRLNLLSDRFLRAGFAVVWDEHGEAWVVEEFAGR